MFNELFSKLVVTWADAIELFKRAASAVTPNVRIENVIVAVDGAIFISAFPWTVTVIGGGFKKGKGGRRNGGRRKEGREVGGRDRRVSKE